MRISLGGGGTDLPSFYENNEGGFLIAAAITKYVFVSIHENFEDRFSLKYSKFEEVEKAEDIRHPMLREAIKYTQPDKFLEITSIADIPAGTGLGSSGTFAVGLLNALFASKHLDIPKRDLASLASMLEIEVLGEPAGKQDQYMAALGGLNSLTFEPNGEVIQAPIALSDVVRDEFEESLLLFYTGMRRSASSELESMDKGASIRGSETHSNLLRVRDLGHYSYETLSTGNLVGFGDLLTQQWNLKFQRAQSDTHRLVDSWIRAGIEAGALGGKLVGAGGGGFLLFMAENKSDLRKTMREFGLREVKFGFDYLGTVIE